MRPARNFFWAIALLLPFLFLNASNALAAFDDEDADDYVPEVTARVARVSFLRGDVQIKRAGEKDWERAAQNLPIVEGDEITTDAGARLEIQFDSRTFLRLAENSYLKITTLKDEGIALSLPEGSLSARVLEFNKSEKYFEIDAPKTTVALERAGMYRVDAGDARSASEVRVAVSEGGEARLYSENSGFTLRNGRSARIYLEGNYAGEWETSDAARYSDDFDAWASERDLIIAKRLQTAAYDKYYDRDFYGAEDLSDYGEWISTKKYGSVWRPYHSATSGYADWSPYRYGQWRWLPQYGWTWVNDEPWGWATYHHGRWIYVDDVWAWTPYPQHRARRSWWRPALVVINYVGANVCWYPLPYQYNYYNYNSTYIDRRVTVINNTNVIVNRRGGGRRDGDGRKGDGSKIERKPPIFDVPPGGVVAVDRSEFGRGKNGYRKPPIETAKRALEKTLDERDDSSAIALPTRSDLNGRISREIAVENPRAETRGTRVRTGASERKGGAPTDENLRQERIFANRPPIQRTPPVETAAGENPARTERRETGAVKRQPRTETARDGNSDGGNSVVQAPGGRPIRSTGGKSENNNDGDQTNSTARERRRDREQTPPVSVPPTQTEQQRRDRRQDSPPQPQQQEERRERRPSPPESRQSPPREEPKPPQQPQQRREEKPQQEQRRTQPSEEPPPSKRRESESVDKDN